VFTKGVRELVDFVGDLTATRSMRADPKVNFSSTRPAGGRRS
jgi:hypothetical protein